METQLLTPREVDLLLRYPAGRTLRLAKAGRIPCIRLPDGEIRIDMADLETLLRRGAEGVQAMPETTTHNSWPSDNAKRRRRRGLRHD